MVTEPHSSRLADILWMVLGLFGLSILALAATASQLQTVADQPWPLWSGKLHLPAGWVTVAAPMLLTAAGLLGAWRCRSRASSWRAPASALWVAGLAALWLVCLVRHDRALTALHLGCLVLALTALPASGLWRVLMPTALVPLLALVSYGAIWGETRCDEPEGMKCLVASGPRVWVPAALQRAGLHVFIDLRQADLRGVDWRYRDLRLADLRGARMDGAKLAGSNLRRARLDGIQAPDSNWQGVFMNGASMSGAELSRANLQMLQAYWVDLRGTNLDRADLRRASFSHALWQGAVFGQAKLQGTYLRFGTGLQPVQLQHVAGDSATRWPDELGPSAALP